jgi:hypothetical protein
MKYYAWMASADHDTGPILVRRGHTGSARASTPANSASWAWSRSRP